MMPNHPLLEFFFGPRGFYQEPQQQQPVMGSGSGVILSSDGFIVTNNHVIDKADEIEVTLNDKRTFKAVKVGTDPTTDIALLKIDASDLPYLRYGNSDDLRIGEWVLAVGNPFNLNSTVTAGIVSAKSRSIQILGRMSIEAFIQTDAAVNAGNSGGALVNTRGELVGINTAITERSGGNPPEGIGFAIPVDLVRGVTEQLIQHGRVIRGYLGLEKATPLPAQFASAYGIDGWAIVVDEVVGPAAEAGIRPGDILTHIDGNRLRNDRHAKALVG